MIQTWKFSIKPETDLDAFEKCRELGIVGVGWSHCYEDKQPENYEEAKQIADQYWEYKVDGLRKLFDEINPGDHLWMHKNGHYYLCIAGSKRLFARDICEDFRKYDLGHAIDAKWLKIPDELVCGSIQRGVIARRMIQRIGVSEIELKLNIRLANCISDDENWFPVVDCSLLHENLKTFSTDDIFSIMSPDDIEDIIASILQNEGWVLLKSTCFRSKPKFEFSLINGKSKTCLVQVKSGKYPQQLPPEEYAEYLNGENSIVLFSSHPAPYPGNSIDNIRCITKAFVYEWILGNPNYLSPTLKLKFSLAAA